MTNKPDVKYVIKLEKNTNYDFDYERFVVYLKTDDKLELLSDNNFYFTNAIKIVKNQSKRNSFKTMEFDQFGNEINSELTENTDELKKCPFCGHCAWKTEPLTSGYFIYACSNSECQVKPSTDRFKDEEKAFNAWNKRV